MQAFEIPLNFRNSNRFVISVIHFFFKYTCYLAGKTKLLNILRIKFVFEYENDHRGLFSSLTNLVDFIFYCEKANIPPEVFYHSDNYGIPNNSTNRNLDVLDRLFDVNWRNHCNPTQNFLVFRVTFGHFEDFPNFRNIVKNLDKERIKQIIDNYFNPNLRIRAMVSDFIESEEIYNYCSVHWRGTDKSLEAPEITLREVIETIDRKIAKSENILEAIFIASDSRELLELLIDLLKSTHPKLKVKFRENNMRAVSSSPIHLQGDRPVSDKLFILDESLIDCLILSKGSFLVRNSSFLSAWSSLFNSKLDSICLNRHNAASDYFDYRWIKDY